jgi:uncharacterized repeat protein (TIGR03803 family)
LLLLLLSVGWAQTEANVVSFTGQSSWSTWGGTPTQGHNGRLYGICHGPAGSIYNLSANGTLTLICAFTSSSEAPDSAPLLATDGNFYGTATGGGTANFGVFYKLTPNGTCTVLHSFLGGSDGSGPVAAPIQGSDGNLYGTTSGSQGPATVYKYTRSGKFTTIYVFDQSHGTYVDAPLIQGTDGNLYGTAWRGLSESGLQLSRTLRHVGLRQFVNGLGKVRA